MSNISWCCVGIVLAVTTASDPADDPIVGKWTWFNGGTVTISPDGTFVHDQGNRGAWTVKDRAQRDYVLRWSQGGFVDAVTLSEDGQSLLGTSQSGVAISARRVREGTAARPQPQPSSAPPGQPPVPPDATPVRLKTTETSLGKAENLTPSLPIMSLDGRHQMYQIFTDNKVNVALDGVPGKDSYDAVDHLIFSADGKRTAFLALRGGKAVAVVDGAASQGADQVNDLQFSPDGKRVGYVLGWNQPGTATMPHRAVIDGEAGPLYNGVSDLVFSADGKHVAYAAVRGTRLKDYVDAVVVRDGKEGKGYEMIVGGSLRYLPDGRLAYVASRAAPPRGLTEVAVIDGAEGPEASELTFSPDGKHVAAVAGGNNLGTMIAVDGKPGKSYPGVISNVTFSPDGAHLAFTVVNTQTAKFVEVVDGKAGAPYEEIRDFQFGADGTRFAYVAKKDGLTEVCVTDVGEEKSGIAVSELLFSPDGKHVAYRVQNLQGSAVVRDGKAEKTYFQILEHSLRFSPDGKRLAYWAATPPGIAVVADGVEGKVYPVPGFAPGLTFSPDGKRLAYTAKRDDDKGVVVVDGVESAPFDRVLDAPVVFGDANHLCVLAVRSENLIRLEAAINAGKEP